MRDAWEGEMRASFQFLSYQNEMHLAERLLMDGLESVHTSIRKLIQGELTKTINKKDEQRCRIMIKQSRLLFGVCDPSDTSIDGHGKLEQGKCFVRITNHEDGEPRTIVNTEVLVTRNPCLHPGDLQKFKVVDVPEWTHLTDCIVFPTSSNRPSADLMSGGDLDGDKFFVTWDPDIIPRKIAQAAAYPAGKQRIEFEEITADRRAEFFARYTNASLGRVKNLYLKWARLKGPLSPECQQLNRLFSQCVDGNRTRIPQNLEDPPEPAGTDGLSFVLDVLHENAIRQVAAFTNSRAALDTLPGDLLDFISSREDSALSEFELVQLVLRKCKKEGLHFGDYAPYFNYPALSEEQRLWVLDILPPTKGLPDLVRNGLLQSGLVQRDELRVFGLDHHRLHWKPIFATSTDRMGQFLTTAGRALENFHKKLIIIQADERLLLMIYIPQKIARATETDVSDSVRVFALPRSAGVESARYTVKPTKSNSRLYYDDAVFQLYEEKRGNTFVYLQKGPQDLSAVASIESRGDRRRKKQETVDTGINYDFRASVALGKINEPVRRHVGRMNRAGIQAAEVYVISNRDVESMHFLDAWLDYVDTEEVLPLFASSPKEYVAPTLESLEHDNIPPAVRSVVWDGNVSAIKTMTRSSDICLVLELLDNARERTRLRNVYGEILQYVQDGTIAMDGATLVRLLLDGLAQYPFLAHMFLESKAWTTWRDSLATEASEVFPKVLRELVLSANHLQSLIRHPFMLLLKEISRISLQELADLIELVALGVEQPNVALDLLLDCIQPEIARLLNESPKETEQIICHLMGIALNHIDEGSSESKPSRHSLELSLDGHKDGFEVVKASLRIDIPEGPPKIGDHVRFMAIGPPRNAPTESPYTMDAVVVGSDQGSASFRCIHRIPSYLADCTWSYKSCGSFLTSKAMLDAVTKFYGEKTACCSLYHQLVGISAPVRTELEPLAREENHDATTSKLNKSQNMALTAALENPLAFLWGPPGTGKTQTIVTILKTLLSKFPLSRFLITAPTHNAVDNTLHRFIAEGGTRIAKPLRVATDVRKVSPQLRQYTCDAMVGKDLSESHAGRRAAQKKINSSRLVFTTCVGSALGLLREEVFDIVLVDEASQQTEPETLIPLTKGCKRAILVGDHVQLRATVERHAVITGFDISLFERHYELPSTPGVAKVMLDTQYRMHPDICAFSSETFYQGRLKSDQRTDMIGILISRFPFPKTCRKVFLQCDSTEDLGNQSKANSGQVKLCQLVFGMLSDTTLPTPDEKNMKNITKPEVVILTPYTRQREALQTAIPTHGVSSIDGFQGREADIIVFVTVRCNQHYDIGFLKDMRRLNVAMTRAKAGVIIIGHRSTLTTQASGDSDADSKIIWKKLLDQCVEIQLVETTWPVLGRSP